MGKKTGRRRQVSAQERRPDPLILSSTFQWDALTADAVENPKFRAVA